MYCYGMTERPRSPGAQPRGYTGFRDFPLRTLVDGYRVWSLLWYERELTPEEVMDYELVQMKKSG